MLLAIHGSDKVMENMVNISFPVTEIRGEKASGSGIATRLGLDGMELQSKDVPPGRFAWIGFTLPDTGRTVKVLGEIMGIRRDGTIDSVTVRFKHLFPNDRQILSGLISARAAA
ncbi:MAG TPA: PilZ domain-containing protein [Myxococcota bacterium]|nr:PilZ domain-containing protein [Myxococcota bacterium]